MKVEYYAWIDQVVEMDLSCEYGKSFSMSSPDGMIDWLVEDMGKWLNRVVRVTDMAVEKHVREVLRWRVHGNGYGSTAEDHFYAEELRSELSRYFHLQEFWFMSREVCRLRDGGEAVGERLRSLSEWRHSLEGLLERKLDDPGVGLKFRGKILEIGSGLVEFCGKLAKALEVAGH